MSLGDVLFVISSTETATRNGGTGLRVLAIKGQGEIFIVFTAWLLFLSSKILNNIIAAGSGAYPNSCGD